MTLHALAAAQTSPVRGDVAANVAQHVRLADLAAEERARVEAACSGGLTLIVGAQVRLDELLCIGASIIAPDRR